MYFSSTFSPLIQLSPPLLPYCYPCPWVFFFFFCSMPPPSFLPTHLAVILFSICEAVSILHVSSVCSLGSTYEWNHMVSVSLFWICFIDLRERERERDIYLFFHVCTHWLTPVCALTRDGTQSPGISGKHSKKLSYPVKTKAISLTDIRLFIYFLQWALVIFFFQGIFLFYFINQISR